MVIEAVAQSQIRLLPESALLNVSAPNDCETVPGKPAVAVESVTVLPLLLLSRCGTLISFVGPYSCISHSFSEMTEIFQQKLSREYLPKW